ncbi:hypothetical protein NEISICOT_01701 [Neisseria sicca ATCC 29256]|uniref:Uncharacterized protein n=1 Tax=Neisseria sicca ATCC 29256 TaxID=547045 RepID=C6M5A2_NEISI|nr:hypothetical protein NEISICOT_01701 [Neisseria sicca ATCC 29256]
MVIRFQTTYFYGWHAKAMLKRSQAVAAKRKSGFVAAPLYRLQSVFLLKPIFQSTKLC